MKYTDEYLNSRLSWIEKSDDTLLYNEVPHASIETMDHFTMGLAKLCKANLNTKYLIVNLSEAELPTAELRRHISEIWKNHAILFEAICVFSDKNKLINIAVQFVISFQPKLLKRTTMHSDFAHCLTKIENVKRAKST